jgi:hypothetical protein
MAPVFARPRRPGEASVEIDRSPSISGPKLYKGDIRPVASGRAGRSTFFGLARAVGRIGAQSADDSAVPWPNVPDTSQPH